MQEGPALTNATLGQAGDADQEAVGVEEQHFRLGPGLHHRAVGCLHVFGRRRQERLPRGPQIVVNDIGFMGKQCNRNLAVMEPIRRWARGFGQARFYDGI